MANDKKQSTGDFKTLAIAEPYKLGFVTYFISLQKITNQETGNFSDHLVIKKQAMNEDGSPRGQSRQLFLPRDDATKVLKYASDFLIKQKI